MSRAGGRRIGDNAIEGRMLALDVALHAAEVEREGGTLPRSPRPPAEQVKSDGPRTASENVERQVGPETWA